MATPAPPLDDRSLPSRLVPIEDGTLHCVDVGTGPVVVLVHGSPLSSFSFRTQIARLARRFRVVAPDLLCFGASSCPPEGAGFARQRRALRQALDALALGDDLRYVVHDWGGAIGLGCAVERPEDLRQLVLINTSIRPGFRPPWYWRAFTAPGLGDALVVGANVFGRGLPLLLRAARDSQIRRHYRRPFERPGTRRTVLRLERLEGFDAECRRITDVLAGRQIPTAVLWGTPDPYFRRGERERLLALVAGAELRVIPGGGHFPQEDAPAALADALDDVLAL